MKLRDERYVVFPVAASIYPVLALTAENAPAGVNLGSAAFALLLAALVGLFFWLASVFLTRDPDRRTLIALAGVATFAGYGYAMQVAGESGIALMANERAKLLVYISAIIAASVWVAKTRRNLITVARTFRLMAVILLLFPTGALIAGPAFARAPTMPSGGHQATGPTDKDSLRDIYFIVVDKYTGSRALAANYGYDNSPFEERLRSRGFVVPRDARSNYVHTMLSLPSMLNWMYMDEMLQEQNDAPLSRFLQEKIWDNRTSRFLKAHGYEYVFVPSSFPATRTNPFADRQVPAPRSDAGLNVTSAWITRTPLPSIVGLLCSGPCSRSAFPYHIETADQVRRRVAHIVEAGRDPGPQFVLAHLLVPHEPYVFNADCSPREPYWPPADNGPDAPRAEAAYRDQISCLNTLLDGLVVDILKRSSIPPIILIQSDHGHGQMMTDPVMGEHLSLEELSPARLDERTAIFAAYYLPDGGAVAVDDQITPINVMPAILNHYFDASIPLHANRTYWSTLHDLVQFTRVR